MFHVPVRVCRLTPDFRVYHCYVSIHMLVHMAYVRGVVIVAAPRPYTSKPECFNSASVVRPPSPGTFQSGRLPVSLVL